MYTETVTSAHQYHYGKSYMLFQTVRVAQTQTGGRTGGSVRQENLPHSLQWSQSDRLLICWNCLHLNCNVALDTVKFKCTVSTSQNAWKYTTSTRKPHLTGEGYRKNYSFPHPGIDSAHGQHHVLSTATSLSGDERRQHILSVRFATSRTAFY